MRTTSLGAWCFLIAIAMALALVRSAPAQDPDPDSAVLLKLHGKVTQFLDGIHGDDQAKAFNDLLDGSNLSKNSDAFKALLGQSREIEKKYGKFQESEQISARKIGKDLVVLKYLFKCESFPVVWYFTYYKDFSHRTSGTEDENWVIVSVRFDTQLESLAATEDRRD